MRLRIPCSGLPVAAALLAMFVLPAKSFAHHAFTAQYDPDHTGTLTGVVVKVEWLNPHAYFYVDVTGEDGTVATWACELTSPVGLMRRGWTRNSLAIGDVVEVSGALARDGSPSLNAGTVVLSATGQRLFGRSRDEERQAAGQGSTQ